jgi:uncharacterized damage-inducible protein DinB
MSSAKDSFLRVYEQEHATTLRVLDAYPDDKWDLRPHPKCNTALELAWVFVMERKLGAAVYNDAFAEGPPSGEGTPMPETWAEVRAALVEAHEEFGDLVRAASDEELEQTVTFFVGPKQMGDWVRMDWLWFLLHDQIHHRGQLSIYLRMADGKVPSIYGPSADEPWM